jgi:hypothetical protein
MSFNVAGYSLAVCPNKECGVRSYIPDYIEAQALKLGVERKLFCPNGHVYHFVQSDLDRMQDQISALNRRLTEAKSRSDSYEFQYETQKKKVSYWKGIAHRKPRFKKNAGETK